MRARTALLAVFTLASLALAAPASAAIGDSKVGDLAYKGCLSGETAVTPCAFVPKASANGLNSGLSGPFDLALSPNGENLYAAIQLDDGVAGLSRNGTGALGYQACISGKEGLGPAPGSETCTLTPGAQMNGLDSGLRNTSSVVASADGEAVYVASGIESSISFFNRNPTTGALSFIDCVTTDPAVAGCALNGDAEGALFGARLALSPDDDTLYASARDSATIMRFEREPSGELGFVGCQTGDSDLDVFDCEELPTATSGGHGSGLDRPGEIVFSSDGSRMYVPAAGDSAVSSFEVHPTDGSLQMVDCLTAATDLPVFCRQIPGATADAEGTGLNGPLKLAISGANLYVSSEAGDAVATLGHTATGELSYVGCLSGSAATSQCQQAPGATATGALSGFNGASWIVASGDGRSVYFSGSSDDAVVRLDRAADGTVAFGGCLSGDTAVANCTPVPGATSGGPHSGLSFTRGLALSPDDRSLYITSYNDDAITTFERDLTEPSPAPPGPPAPGGGDTTPPQTKLGKKPKGKLKTAGQKLKVKFTFSSSEPGSTFQCKIDKKAWKKCKSPSKLNLKLGKHTFQVKAVDAAGNADPTPAKRTIRIVPKEPKK